MQGWSPAAPGPGPRPPALAPQPPCHEGVVVPGTVAPHLSPAMEGVVLLGALGSMAPSGHRGPQRAPWPPALPTMEGVAVPGAAGPTGASLPDPDRRTHLQHPPRDPPAPTAPTASTHPEIPTSHTRILQHWFPRAESFRSLKRPLQMNTFLY